MLADHERGHGDRAGHRTDTPAHPSAAPLLALSPGEITPASSSGLLDDPRLSGRGNAPIRSILMRQVQQTYGNRAAQRRLSGAAPGLRAGFGAQAVQGWQAARAARGRPAPATPAPGAPGPLQRHILAGVPGWEAEQPVQRTPVRGILRVPIQRLISKDAWIAFSGVDVQQAQPDTKKKSKAKDKQQVDPEKAAFTTLADLLGQYEATKTAAQDETNRANQFKILYGIEHTIYGLFETAPDRGNNRPWKKEVYWLLDNVQEEYTRKIAEPGKYYARDQDTLSKTKDDELQSLWGKIKQPQSGQATFNITNKENAFKADSPQHAGFDTEIYAAFARLIAMPKGRELVAAIIQEVGGDAKRTIDISPLPAAKAAQGVIAETAPSGNAGAATGEDPGPGPGTSMKMPAHYRDTDVRTYSKPAKGEDLGPQYEVLAPFYIMLGHELIHALHNLRKENKKKTVFKEGSKDAPYENLEEKNTILGTSNDEDISEADLRREHDIFATRFAHTHTQKSADPTTVKREDRVKERWEQSVRAFQHEAARTIKDFIPSTKTGMFNAKLTPATGALDITVRLHLDLQAIQTDNYNESWTQTEANNWMAKLQANIPAAWNNKARFKLHNPEKPAATMTVTPTFHVVSSYTIDAPTKPKVAKVAPTHPTTGGATAKAGPTSAHFNIKAYRGTKEAYDPVGFDFSAIDPNKVLISDAKKDTRITSDPIFGHQAGQARPQGTGFFHHGDVDFMQHNAFFLDEIAKAERDLFKRLLGDTGLTLKYKSALRKPTVIAQETQDKLDQFAAQCKSIYPPPAVKFPLLVKGGNKKQAQLVINYLQQKPSVTNRLTFQKSKDKVLTVDAAYVATPQDDVGSQLTAAHEFGHMLGLPDDYVKLQGAASTQQETYQYQDAAKGLDINLDKALKEKLESGTKSGTAFAPAQEKALLDLAQQANVPVPTTFGAKTDTMMGAGDKFLPHHFVTVWEALTQLTKDYFPAQFWQIAMG